MEPERAEHRVFFALWPPAAAAARLHAAAVAAQCDCGGRAMRGEDLHITLAFLGKVSADRLAQAEAVADTIAAPAFDVALDRLGWWKHNRILWAGCSNAVAGLTELAAVLGAGLRAAGFVLDERPFAVHATLLRNARCAAPAQLLVPPVAWHAGDFVLAESMPGPDGSRYAARRRWPLQSPALGGAS